MAENQLSFDIKVGGNQDQAIGSLKKQLREAQQDVQALSDKFGATSEQAIEAAKRASELKDRIGDAKALTDAFNPDAKFKALTASLSGVAGGFAAAQGAIGLFGAESEAVEKTLLKVQSAMALSQGLQSVGESIDSFKQLGAVIKSTTAFQTAYNFVIGEKAAIQKSDVATTVASTVATKAQAAATNTATVATTASSVAMKVLRGAILATGIGALVIGLIAVVQNFGKIKTAILNAIPGLGKFASTVGNVINAFTDLIGVTNAASRAEQQRQAIFTKAAAGTKIINEGIDRQIKLLQAQGAEQGKLDALRKQQINNELNDLKKLADQKGILRGEEAKKYKDLKNDLAVIDATAETARREAVKQSAKRGTADANKYGESQKKQDEQLAKERLEAQKEALLKLSELNNEIFLSTFKDENEKKRVELNLAFNKERDEILANTKITEETRNQLIVALRTKLNTDLEALAVAEKERKAAADAKMLEETAAQVTKENEDEYAAVQKKIKENNQLNEKLKADNDAARTAELQAKFAFANAVAQGIGELTGLFEQGTAASKIAGLAQIAISTGVGFAQGLDIAQKSAKATGPGAAFAFPIFYATQVAAVLAAASKAKSILAQVKGGGAAGSVTAPTVQQQAPIAPAQPQAQTTSLNTETINALGNQATRAYVIESDVTSSQQRIAAIQQRARFG
jgi:hypothetical protein